MAAAHELAGLRPAGKPLSCVSTRMIPETRIIDESRIIFGNGRSEAYLNAISPACPGLARDRAIVTRVPSTRFCRGDLFTVIDPTTHIDYGSCAFGDFQPYRR